LHPHFNSPFNGKWLQSAIILIWNAPGCHSSSLIRCEQEAGNVGFKGASSHSDTAKGLFEKIPSGPRAGAGVVISATSSSVEFFHHKGPGFIFPISLSLLTRISTSVEGLLLPVSIFLCLSNGAAEHASGRPARSQARRQVLRRRDDKRQLLVVMEKSQASEIRSMALQLNPTRLREPLHRNLRLQPLDLMLGCVP
jgi:hypothetical protein